MDVRWLCWEEVKFLSGLPILETEPRNCEESKSIKEPKPFRRQLLSSLLSQVHRLAA